VVSQPLPSLLTPGGQGSWTNSHEGPRQGRPTVQQVLLPGPWPGQSVQQHQQAQPAAPSHANRRSSKSEDGPLPPLPQDTEPNGESVPATLRPGGPSRMPMHPIHETRVVPPDTRAQERNPAGAASHSTANGTAGHHQMMPSDTDPNTHSIHPHTIHQNIPPFSSLPAPPANIPSLLQTQSHAHQVSSYSMRGTPEHVGFASGGHAITQPPQAQPELPHAQYHSQSQTPPQQRQQVQHSPWQQAQSPVGQLGHHASPHLPDNHPAQLYVATSGPTIPGQPYVAASSPAPPSHSHIPSQTPSSLSLSHITTQGPPPVLHAQPYATSPSPVLSARPHAASPSPGPSVPPAHLYPTASSPIPPTQAYPVPPVPSAQQYTTPVQPTQPYVSPASSILSPHVHPPVQPAPSQSVQSYMSPPNPTFSLPMSPPSMSPYGPSYAPGHAPSFPVPTFPVPQVTSDYFETDTSSPYSPRNEPDLPYPYLAKRYQTPLPLPPGASHPQVSGSSPNAISKPRPSPPAAAAAVVSTRRHEREDASERAARELQCREEESAHVHHEQEEWDAELARTLDLEFNAESAPQDSHDRPSQLQPLRAGTVGYLMPGWWLTMPELKSQDLGLVVEARYGTRNQWVKG
jgi:hypothetical protein